VEEVFVITDHLPNNEDYQLESGLNKVKIIPTWSFNNPLNAWKILKTIRNCQPDAVLYNIQFLSFGDKKISAALGLLTPMITRLFGFPSISLLHNIIETVDLENAGISSNKWLNKIYNFIGSIMTRIILASNQVALTIPKYVEILQRKYNAKNVVHMPHGTFEVNEEPQYKNRLEGKKSVMAFGKFGTYKKVENLIEAVQIVKERMGEEIEVVIAGTDNPNVKGYLAGVAEQYKNVSDLKFTGYVAEEDVPKIFKDCSVTVFPYTSTTGSSGVLHQAGSYGKAAVLPLLGDLKELVEEEGYSGAFFEAGSIISLADAIESVLSNNAYRVDLERTNYAAASQLSMSNIVDRYIRAFENLGVRTNKESAPQLAVS
jgi:glycosyltransferase involved in cell wall biosynthesis